MMEILRKGITHDKVFYAQNVMRKAGMPWHAFFMIGLPDDRPETIADGSSHRSGFKKIAGPAWHRRAGSRSQS
jgi:hypothetical protein